MGLLDILRENEISATFFIQNKLATKYPALVKIIGLEGHEIACFIDHFENTSQSKLAIRSSIYTLENLINKKVIGTRCSTLSLLKTNFNEYCYLLKKMGVKYDSSLLTKRPIDQYFNKNISLKAFDYYDISQHTLPLLLTLPKSLTRVRSKDKLITFGGTLFRFLPYELNYFLARPLDKNSGVFSIPISDLGVREPNEKTLKSSVNYYAKKSIPEKLQNLFSDYPFSSFIHE